jgi:hypothetical protein
VLAGIFELCEIIIFLELKYIEIIILFMVKHIEKFIFMEMGSLFKRKSQEEKSKRVLQAEERLL